MLYNNNVHYAHNQISNNAAKYTNLNQINNWQYINQNSNNINYIYNNQNNNQFNTQSNNNGVEVYISELNNGINYNIDTNGNHILANQKNNLQQSYSQNNQNNNIYTNNNIINPQQYQNLLYNNNPKNNLVHPVNNSIIKQQPQNRILFNLPQQVNNNDYNYWLYLPNNSSNQQIFVNQNQDYSIQSFFNNNNNNLKISQNNNFNNFQNNNNYSNIREPTDNSKIKVVLDMLTRARGLENVGATCYMNATLQCFYHVKRFSETLINDYNINKTLEMTYCYKNLIEELSGCKDRKKYMINRQYHNQYDNSKNYVKPGEFKELIGRKNPLFKGINANDSKDLVIFMLENMDAELTKRNNKISNMEIFQGDDERQTENQNFKKIHNSIVAELFYGFQRTVMKCKNCQQANKSFSVFNFLLFPLEKIYNSLNQKNKMKIMRNRMMNYNNMINSFNKILNNNNNMLNYNNNIFNRFNNNNLNMYNYRNNMMNNNMNYYNNNMMLNNNYYNNMMNNYNMINNMMPNNNMMNYIMHNNIMMNNMMFNNNMINNIPNNNMAKMFNNNTYENNISNYNIGQYFNINNRNNMINQLNNPSLNNISNIPDLPRKLTLINCFEDFEAEDLLTGQNQIYCNFCNRSSDASTKTEIFKSPNVLIIILNRGRGNVFECDVDFGLELNISNFAKKNDSPKDYKLIGVISHLGESSMEGHFIAFCKHFDDNWYLFNDAIVSNISEKDIFRGTPYILFYQNKGLT